MNISMFLKILIQLWHSRNSQHRALKLKFDVNYARPTENVATNWAASENIRRGTIFNPLMASVALLSTQSAKILGTFQISQFIFFCGSLFHLVRKLYFGSRPVMVEGSFSTAFRSNCSWFFSFPSSDFRLTLISLLLIIMSHSVIHYAFAPLTKWLDRLFKIALLPVWWGQGFKTFARDF